MAAAFDPTTDRVWTYAAFGTTINSYTRAGVFVSSIPRPGEAADDFDLDVPLVGFTLNGVPLPAGTLLAIDGETGGAEVYALDKTNGAVLATLSTSFGGGHVVGGAWHSQRSTLFLVADKNAAATDGDGNGQPDGNHIAEIDPATGAVRNDFTPGADFSRQLRRSVDRRERGAVSRSASAEILRPRACTDLRCPWRSSPLPGGVSAW